MKTNLIGATPLWQLPNSNIYAKLEMFNLTGSIKDRIVDAIIREGETQGKWQKGDVLVEASSGNTGISLAAIGKLRGYHPVVVLPKSATIERQQLIRQYGADLIITDSREKSIDKVRILVKEKGYKTLAQFDNPVNYVSHYETTAQEILTQFRGKIDYLVVGIGTGGTITGLAQKLREKFPQLKVIGVMPEAGEQVDGLINIYKTDYRPAVLNMNLIDDYFLVRRSDALQEIHRLQKLSGLLVGISSGAASFVSHQLPSNQNIITIFPDGGWKYLSVF